MGVCVCKSGQNRGIRKIDEVVARGAPHLRHRTDADNLFSFDNDGLIGQRFSCLHF